MENQESLVSKAARLGDAPLEWNEIDFVGWPEFRRMAPSVVGLEIGRMEHLIAGSDVGGDFYNTLIQVRYALRRFIEGIEASEKATALLRAKDLEKALLALSTALEDSVGHENETLRYTAHRLTYIHNRLRLIY